MEGRIPTGDELIHPKENIERKAIEIVLRELHAERAEKLASLPWKDQGQTKDYYLIEDIDLQQTFGELIGKIAYSHWWDISTIEEGLDFPVNAPYWCPRDWTINPLFLACLLRVADISNVDAARAPGFLRSLRKPAPSAKDHWIFQEYLQQPDLAVDRLRYTSGRPFSVKDAQAWWLCFDTLQTVDHELRMVDALLADHGGRRFVARGVTGIEEPRRLAKYIRTENWLPVDAHIQVSDITRLIQQLGGEELYGKDYTVPLRELIQNAADAVRARRIEENLPNWGRVDVRLGKDEIGEWIGVEDNGLGMSTEVLAGALLDFGKSYWGSSLMRSQFPGLASKGFQSTGRYGIGFFSVFMWGNRVSVISRRFDAALRDTQVLEFNHGLNSRPILRTATKSEYLREGGTRIRVWFKSSSTLLFSSPLLDSDPVRRNRNRSNRRMFDRIQIRDIRKLCAFLCPSIDVDLYVTDIRGDTELVISSNDWTTMNGEDLLRRLLDFDQYADERTAEELIRQYAPALTLVKNSSGETVGRACITPSQLQMKDGSRPTVAGVITVGGLRSSILSGYLGIWDGISLRATRDLASPVVQSADLARWATDQAKLMGSLITDPELLFEIADFVNACGGDVGDLPIASGINGWMNFSQIAEWQNVPDEILLISDAFFSLEQRKHKKLTLHSNVLVTSEAFMIPIRSVYDEVHPLHWPYMKNLLDRVVIEALAKAWSSPLEDVMQVSKFTNDEQEFKREVGMADGKSIVDSVNVIKNPKKKP